MSERNKSLLIILSTLLIGMLIGALVWSSISRDRHDRLANLRETDGMVDFIIENLEPLEEGQREGIMGIVRSHGDEMVEIRNQMNDLRSSLRTDLDEILNDDQQEKLNRFMRSQRGRRGRGSRPPRGDRMDRGPRAEGDSLGARGGPGEDRRNRRRDRRPPPPRADSL